jgi:hypothetical protein
VKSDELEPAGPRDSTSSADEIELCIQSSNLEEKGLRAALPPFQPLRLRRSARASAARRPSEPGAPPAARPGCVISIL